MSRPRSARLHDALANHVSSGAMPGLVALPRPPRVFTDFWTSAYQSIDD
jgi:hypothetical protein